jgi:hypothetical protein
LNHDENHQTQFLLFSNAFRAFQCLTSFIRDTVDDPVALLFTGDKILLFEDIEMV